MLGSMFGQKCYRCDEKNAKQAKFCEHCGISLAFARSAILIDNRWEAQPDELAVFFMSQNLKGLFSKPLRVPPGMRAWVLQDNQTTELKEGEYAVETLLDRINSFFLGQHVEILITRQAALPVKFVFDDICSAELLPVTVETTLFVRVGDKAAFRNHFMLSPGAVSCEQLRSLMHDSVKQVVAEAVGGHHLAEMTQAGALRQEIDEALLRKLSARFIDYGLAFDAADTLSLRHDRFDANRQLQGSLWLEVDEARQQAEHKKAFNEIYDQQEWLEIHQREEAMRRRYREAEIDQEEAEFAHVIRLRELDLYSKVASANNREQVIRSDARDQLLLLEHEQAERRLQRERDAQKSGWLHQDVQDNWRHTQEVAAIRRDAEKRAIDLKAQHDMTLMQARIDNELEKIRIAARMELARSNDDASLRSQGIQLEEANLRRTKLREDEIKQAQHEALLQELRQAAELKKRQVERGAAWEDKQLEQRLAEVDASLAQTRLEIARKGMADLMELDRVTRSQTRQAVPEEVARLQELRVSEQRQIFENSLGLVERLHGESLHTIKEVAVAKPQPVSANPVQVVINNNGKGARICGDTSCGTVNKSSATCCTMCGKPF